MRLLLSIPSRHIISNSKDQSIKLWDIRRLGPKPFSSFQRPTFPISGFPARLPLTRARLWYPIRSGTTGGSGCPGVIMLPIMSCHVMSCHVTHHVMMTSSLWPGTWPSSSPGWRETRVWWPTLATQSSRLSSGAARLLIEARIQNLQKDRGRLLRDTNMNI